MKNIFEKLFKTIIVFLVVFGCMAKTVTIMAEDEPVPDGDSKSAQTSITVINGTREDSSTHEQLEPSQTYDYNDGDDVNLGFMQPSEGYLAPKITKNGVDITPAGTGSYWNSGWNIEYFVNSGYPNGWVRLTGYDLSTDNPSSFTVEFLPIEYTIAFDANGGQGEMAPITAKYGEQTKLPACTMKNSGLVFAGWNTAADGGGDSYRNKASVSSLTTEKDATVTLYAQWKKAEPKPDPEPAPEPVAIPVTGVDAPAVSSLPGFIALLGTCIAGIAYSRKK